MPSAVIARLKGESKVVFEAGPSGDDTFVGSPPMTLETLPEVADQRRIPAKAVALSLKYRSPLGASTSPEEPWD